MRSLYILLLVVVLLAVSVNSSAAADNSTANATACAGNSTAIEAQGGDVGGALALDDNVTVDSDGVVLQTRNYTCGPAALATVLNNLGINATEQELATLAGTDENGTTMYGLVQAAQSKGLNAVGMKLSVDDLKPNSIVFITVNGGPHYSVVREVTKNSILLADPSLGNIEMTREKFSEVYSGNALVITDPNIQAQEVNQTNPTNDNKTTITSNSQFNQTNNGTNPADMQSNILTTEEMQKIQGKGLRWSYRWCGWYPVRVRAYYGFHIVSYTAQMVRCACTLDADGFDYYYARCKTYGDRYMDWYRRVGYRYAA